MNRTGEVIAGACGWSGRKADGGGTVEDEDSHLQERGVARSSGRNMALAFPIRGRIDQVGCRLSSPFPTLCRWRRIGHRPCLYDVGSRTCGEKSDELRNVHEVDVVVRIEIKNRALSI